MSLLSNDSSLDVTGEGYKRGVCSQFAFYQLEHHRTTSATPIETESSKPNMPYEDKRMVRRSHSGFGFFVGSPVFEVINRSSSPGKRLTCIKAITITITPSKSKSTRSPTKSSVVKLTATSPSWRTSSRKQRETWWTSRSCVMGLRTTLSVSGSTAGRKIKRRRFAHCRGSRMVS